MHVVFGGLFNGKTDYVKQRYVVDSWIEDFWAVAVPTDKTIVVQDFPLIAQPLCEIDEVEAAAQILARIEQFSQSNTVICICDDITRGVVPLDKVERQTRDILGRLYQQLFQQADSVTQIWYGLAKPLK